jgi:hypothetical protein
MEQITMTTSNLTLGKTPTVFQGPFGRNGKWANYWDETQSPVFQVQL